MLHVAGRHPTLQNNRRTRPDQQRNRTRTTRWPCRTLCVHRSVSSHNKRQTTIPLLTFNPRRRIHQCCRSAKARIDAVGAANVRVTAKQQHQVRLDRLCAVGRRLGAHLHTPNAAGTHPVLGKEAADGRQTHRDHVLVVAAHRHPLLPKANRVLARRDAVMALKVALRNIVRRKVDLGRQNADIVRMLLGHLGARSHHLINLCPIWSRLAVSSRVPLLPSVLCRMLLLLPTAQSSCCIKKSMRSCRRPLRASRYIPTSPTS